MGSAPCLHGLAAAWRVSISVGSHSNWFVEQLFARARLRAGLEKKFQVWRKFDMCTVSTVLTLQVYNYRVSKLEIFWSGFRPEIPV